MKLEVKKLLSVHAMNLYGLLICVIMLLGAVYFQFSLGIKPCPLCMIQRVLVVIVGISFFVALCINHVVWLRVANLITTLWASLGIVAAGRHVFIQSLPADLAPACGPELEFMLKHFSLDQVFHLLLQGTANCAEVHWHFLDLSIAGWTLICFIILTLIAFINLLRT